MLQRLTESRHGFTMKVPRIWGLWNADWLKVEVSRLRVQAFGLGLVGWRDAWGNALLAPIKAAGCGNAYMSSECFQDSTQCDAKS